MDPLSLQEILQLAASGTIPLGGIIIWLLWKLDKRIQVLEINGRHRDTALTEIKSKLDTVLSGGGFGSGKDRSKKLRD